MTPVVGLLVGWAAARGAPSLNTLDVADLEALPMIGPARAHLWDDWRRSRGPCSSLDELAVVPGFGPATVAALRGHVTCAPGEPPAAPEAEETPHARVIGGILVDVNSATAEQLLALPGLTPGRAAAIVAHREAAGPFESCEDLVRVPGIGPATVANLRTGERPAICVAR